MRRAGESTSFAHMHGRCRCGSDAGGRVAARSSSSEGTFLPVGYSCRRHISLGGTFLPVGYSSRREIPGRRGYFFRRHISLGGTFLPVGASCRWDIPAGGTVLPEATFLSEGKFVPGGDISSEGIFLRWDIP